MYSLQQSLAAPIDCDGWKVRKGSVSRRFGRGSNPSILTGLTSAHSSLTVHSGFARSVAIPTSPRVSAVLFSSFILG